MIYVMCLIREKYKKLKHINLNILLVLPKVDIPCSAHKADHCAIELIV